MRTYLLIRDYGEFLQVVGRTENIVEFNHRLINLEKIRFIIGSFQLLANVYVDVLEITPNVVKLAVFLQLNNMQIPYEPSAVIAWLQQSVIAQLPSFGHILRAR